MDDTYSEDDIKELFSDYRLRIEELEDKVDALKGLLAARQRVEENEV